MTRIRMNQRHEWTFLLLAATLSCSLAWTPTAFISTATNGPPSLQAISRRPFVGSFKPPTTTSRVSFHSSSSVAQEESSNTATAALSSPFPELGDDGIYTISNPQEHMAFLEAHRDHLVVLKVFAPWCRACKGLAPKFTAVAHDEKYQNLPIVWAQLSVQHNKDFVKSIGVMALPTVQFYVGGAIYDTFPCGPSKVPILKRKLAQLVNTHVDADTLHVKPESIAGGGGGGPATSDDGTGTLPVTATLETVTRNGATAPAVAPRNNTVESQPTVTTTPADAPLISEEERRIYRQSVPHFATMSIADFDQVMDKARLLTFDAGSIIMREGKPGQTFYIIKEGEVEICQKTYAEDPLQSSGQYLGTVVNRLEQGDFFGERSLLTGEPRAASIRAAETTSCYALDRQDFPFSSPLSGRSKNEANFADDLAEADDKYGVNLGGLYTQNVQEQIRQSSKASQIRGSVNKPNAIPGVDTDEDTDDDISEELEQPNLQDQALARDLGYSTASNDAIFNVLRRFKLIRCVGKCFEYITLTNAKWGSSGTRRRRALLLRRLSPAQREDFAETFDLIDRDNNGQISLAELKGAMETVNDAKSDDELLNLMLSSRLSTAEAIDERPELSKQDFMGIMAEAEFYYLFRDIFRSLDPEDSGYVKARDLDRVLSGVRDLISDDRKSIIDVSDADRDMLIDYEQFSRMLLGSSSIA